MYQCCKKCCCQNNMEEDVGPLETSCSDVQSYEENNEDSCQCGFGQEMNLFPTILCLHRVMYQLNIWIKLLPLVVACKTEQYFLN